MDVRDLAEQFALVADVAIESAASLPETWATGVRSQSIENRGVQFFPPCDDLLGDGLLEELQDGSDGICRMQNDVDVFGHDDPGVQPETETVACACQRIDKDGAGSGLAEEWETALAREGHESQAVLAAT